MSPLVRERYQETVQQVDRGALANEISKVSRFGGNKARNVGEGCVQNQVLTQLFEGCHFQKRKGAAEGKKGVRKILADETMVLERSSAIRRDSSKSPHCKKSNKREGRKSGNVFVQSGADRGEQVRYGKEDGLN